jgi:SIR2-like domain
MNLELKKGRNFVNQALTSIYQGRNWSRSQLHTWLASLSLPYIIDTNRDQQLQDAYAERPHTLVLGVARIMGTSYRFRLFEYSAAGYREVDGSEVNPELPVLFKPLGTPNPEPNYIASDADFVDYITELMGGFAIPAFVKHRRRGKRYLILGQRFVRDTERMILSELIHDADEAPGWVFIEEPTPKEARFCERLGLQIVRESPTTLLS